MKFTKHHRKQVRARQFCTELVSSDLLLSVTTSNYRFVNQPRRSGKLAALQREHTRLQAIWDDLVKRYSPSLVQEVLGTIDRGAGVRKAYQLLTESVEIPMNDLTRFLNAVKEYKDGRLITIPTDECMSEEEFIRWLQQS